MGAEAVIRARVAGKADRGRALLETNEVIFRGAQRCVVKLDAATRAKARAEGGWLRIGALELELKADAAKWLAKIQNPKTVLEKLGVKPGQRVALIHVADASFAKGFVKAEPGEADVLFFEVRGPADLKELPRLRKALPDDGVLWLLRPKGKNAPVGERATLAAGKAAGLVDVKVVGFSETLSAEKYVVPVASRRSRATRGEDRAAAPRQTRKK